MSKYYTLYYVGSEVMGKPINAEGPLHTRMAKTHKHTTTSWFACEIKMQKCLSFILSSCTLFFLSQIMKIDVQKNISLTVFTQL